MQSYTPRYYQADAVKAAIQYLKEGGSAGLAVLPTGTGKSHIIADLIQKYFSHNNAIRILMVTHVKELIEQNFDKLKMHWENPPGRPPVGINSAGLNSRAFTQPIIYAGIQSVYRVAKNFGVINLLLIDECHLLSDKSEGMYRQFIGGLKAKNPALQIIGLTATPFRMDMGHLCEGKTFDKVFYNISGGEDFTKLISEGYLSDLKGIQPNDTLDLSKVQKTKNDFSEWSLDEHINRAEITKKIVSETMARINQRKKGLAFCVSKNHAEDMSAKFNEAGLTSTFIHSGLSADHRADRLSGFKNGKFSLIANVGVLTTGFDAPDLDFIVMARPTRSPSLHIQMLGRGMRPHANKKNCLVLDYGGNISRLGFVNEVSLPEASVANVDTPKVKKCQSCDAIIAIASQKCKFCGTDVVVKSAKDIVPLEEAYVGDIIKKTKNKLKPFSVEKKYSDERMVILHASSGYSDNIVSRIFYIDFGKIEARESIGKALFDLKKIKKLDALRQNLCENWKILHSEEISNDDKRWKQIWPKLTSLPGDKLMILFTEYKAYRSAVIHKNLQISKSRENSLTRFVDHVFTHPQVDCPLGNKGGCFFIVAPRRKKWICTSCKVVTDHKSIMESFEGSRPNEKLMTQFEFFRTELFSPG